LDAYKLEIKCIIPFDKSIAFFVHHFSALCKNIYIYSLSRMVDNPESNEIHQEVVLDVNGDTSKNCDEESDTKDSVPLLKKVSLLNFSFLLNKKLIEIKKKSMINL
jgi:hypothetical protein